MTKYFVDKKFDLKTLTTWKRYPNKISNKIVNGVISKSGRNYNNKHVKYVLSLMFSEISQGFQTAEENKVVIFNNFGTFKCFLYDKTIKLPNTKKFKYNCKRIRFAFAFNYKQRCYREFNRENKEVNEYLDEKRKNRWYARKTFC